MKSSAIRITKKTGRQKFLILLSAVLLVSLFFIFDIKFASAEEIQNVDIRLNFFPYDFGTLSNNGERFLLKDGCFVDTPGVTIAEYGVRHLIDGQYQIGSIPDFDEGDVYYIMLRLDTTEDGDSFADDAVYTLTSLQGGEYHFTDVFDAKESKNKKWFISSVRF